MVSDFFLASFSKIQDEIFRFSKLAYKAPQSGKLQKQMHIPPFLEYFGVKKWPQKFCLGTRNAIFLFPKMGPFAKSAHFHVLKNVTLNVQMKNLRLLL